MLKLLQKNNVNYKMEHKKWENKSNFLFDLSAAVWVEHGSVLSFLHFVL